MRCRAPLPAGAGVRWYSGWYRLQPSCIRGFRRVVRSPSARRRVVACRVEFPEPEFNSESCTCRYVIYGFNNGLMRFTRVRL